VSEPSGVQLKIGDRLCGENAPPLMLAEEGQANQGDVELARRMIELAADAGADGIEFQLFLADDMYVRGERGHKIYAACELSDSSIAELVGHARAHGLLFQAACLSPVTAELCARLDVDSFCVNATDLNNPVILDAVSSLGKPFWLATLMATLEEIDWAVEYLERRRATNFGLLHGQHVMTSGSSQGVPPGMAQLGCIPMFQERYGVVVGYVDHTPTLEMPALAVARGASIVLKHLSPEPGWQGPDAGVCLPPEEWKRSKTLFDYSMRTGGRDKSLSQSEISDRTIHRRSLYTTRSIAAGERLAREDLTALRPSTGGMDPRSLEEIIGRRSVRALGPQHLLLDSDLGEMGA